jgi:hypothetical protein
MVRILARVAGAGLLFATAAIHLRLWTLGYSAIHVIGPLFLLNGVAGVVLGVAALSMRGRLLGLAAAGGAMFEAGTLAGLWIATVHGLFGFTESSVAVLYWPSVAVEAAGAVVLASLAGLALLGPRPLPRREHRLHRAATVGR